MAKIEDYLKDQRIIIVLVALGVALLIGLALFLSRGGQGEGTITPDQIRLQKGNKIVTVNKNGLIEYQTVDGVFYQTWTSSQVSDFFAVMEAKAREYLANQDSSICDTGYTVTLYIDGKEVTVCIADDDEVLGEVFEEFPDEEGDGDIGELFDDYFDDDEPGGTVTPTPTPAVVTAEEGEDVPNGGGGGGSLPVVSCDLNAEDVTSRTVISNILCAPDAPSPSPTDVPSPTPTP